MNRHLARLLNGLGVVACTIGGLAGLAGVMAVIIVPLYLADTYSHWWLLLYAPLILTVAYVIGED